VDAFFGGKALDGYTLAESVASAAASSMAGMMVGASRLRAAGVRRRLPLAGRCVGGEGRAARRAAARAHACARPPAN